MSLNKRRRLREAKLNVEVNFIQKTLVQTDQNGDDEQRKSSPKFNKVKDDAPTFA